MSSAGGWSKEIVCGDESSTGSTEEPQYILPPDSSDEDDEIRQEVLINNEGLDTNSLDDALKVDPEDDFSSSIDGNLYILKEHSLESQTRFFNPPDLRKLLHRDELTTIQFLDALYAPNVKFLIFPYIVDNNSSHVFVFEKKRKRSFHVLPGGKFHVFSWDDDLSVVGRGIMEQIQEQNFRVDVVHHKIGSVTKTYRTLFLLELTEELFARVEMELNLDCKFKKLFKALRKKVHIPLTKKYREWNAEKPPVDHDIVGRVEKFAFCTLIIIANGALAVLLYHMSSAFFSWFFFTFVLVSLVPKIYGSWRYMSDENKREKLGFYNDDYIDPDMVYDDDDREWKDVEIEVFRDPNWILRGDKSPILIAANTPMYDETMEELKRTIESYIALVREYPTVEPTFLIDRKEETYGRVMKLMFEEDKIVERNGIYYVLDGHTRMKRLKNRQILYHGQWRGMKNRSFNIIWKPLGGGKRDSQLLFVRLIHLGILTKPRDTILYVDADTSFRPVDFGKLYNGLMRDPKAGAACGEVKVRNKSFKNLFTLAQAYEYLINHMLAKSAESHYGIVLCCPGAWCMYRVEAVEALLPKYCGKPKSMREFHRLEQGEDRYQNSLCLSSGWKAILVKSSQAKTQPKEINRAKKTMEQLNFGEHICSRVHRKTLETRPVMALAMDTLGFYMSPSIFLTLFGNSVGAYLEIRALVIILYTMIFVWILLQMIAGLSLFPQESTKLYNVCMMLGSFLMVFVGIIAVLQIFRQIEQQAPLISGLIIYAMVIFTTAWRYGGWNSILIVCAGGLSYVMFLPLFFITFLLYSVTRYDTTSWR